MLVKCLRLFDVGVVTYEVMKVDEVEVFSSSPPPSFFFGLFELDEPLFPLLLLLLDLPPPLDDPDDEEEPPLAATRVTKNKVAMRTKKRIMAIVCVTKI